MPYVQPTQLHGIEINPYAAEMAVVVWIGYLQWLHVHGITNDRRPILDKLQTMENRDAILAFLPLPQREGREGVRKVKMPSRQSGLRRISLLGTRHLGCSDDLGGTRNRVPRRLVVSV